MDKDLVVKGTGEKIIKNIPASSNKGHQRSNSLEGEVFAHQAAGRTYEGS